MLMTIFKACFQAFLLLIGFVVLVGGVGIIVNFLFEPKASWRAVKTFFSKHFGFKKQKTEAYKQGKTCISFDTFISIYKVNPERWHLEDPCWGYVHYKGKDTWLLYGDKIYWETNNDVKKYKKWYEEEQLRLAREQSAVQLREMTELALSDIEALKNKINQNAQSEFERIDKEKERNLQFYCDLVTSTSLTPEQAKYLINKFLKKEEQE